MYTEHNCYNMDIVRKSLCSSFLTSNIILWFYIVWAKIDLAPGDCSDEGGKHHDHSEEKTHGHTFDQDAEKMIKKVKQALENGEGCRVLLLICLCIWWVELNLCSEIEGNILSHLNWVCIFLGFHSFGFYIHKDTMFAIGHPQYMFFFICCYTITSLHQ